MALIHCNATTADPPTKIIVEGQNWGAEEQEINVSYKRASMYQPTKCTKWVDTPTYLVNVRYSSNMWHTIDEGLASVFQTMRELGHMRLAEVDESGHVREVTDGSDCALMWDPRKQKLVEFNCKQTPANIPRSCTPGVEWWCRPGVFNIDRNSAPILLAHSTQTWKNKWFPLYGALTANIGDWDSLEGACFKELIVGRAHTIDFHEKARPKQLGKIQQAHKAGSLAAFKRAMLSALRLVGRHVETSIQKGMGNSTQLLQLDELSGVTFKGYCDPLLEVLRQGIGPENLNALSVLRRRHGLLSLSPRLKEEFESIQSAESEIVKKAVDHFSQQSGFSHIEYPKVPALIPQGCESAPPSHYVEDLGLVDVPCACWDKIFKAGGGGFDGLKVMPGWDSSVAYEKAMMTSSKIGGSGSSNTAAASMLQQPRPVVTLIKRNFIFPFTALHSRDILNEHDILAYILSRYNVTAKVITFDEPMLTAIRTVAHSDVIIGMHGAAWTNMFFVKPEAVVLQLYPYGWYSDTMKTPIRGHTYKLVAEASGCKYNEWTSSRREYAFLRPADWSLAKADFTLHPPENAEKPTSSSAPKHWIYQASYIDMDEFAGVLDSVMGQAGIQPMHFVV